MGNPDRRSAAISAAANLEAALAAVIAHVGADSGTLHLNGDDG